QFSFESGSTPSSSTSSSSGGEFGGPPGGGGGGSSGGGGGGSGGGFGIEGGGGWLSCGRCLGERWDSRRGAGGGLLQKQDCRQPSNRGFVCSSSRWYSSLQPRLGCPPKPAATTPFGSVCRTPCRTSTLVPSRSARTASGPGLDAELNSV